MGFVEFSVRPPPEFLINYKLTDFFSSINGGDGFMGYFAVCVGG